MSAEPKHSLEITPGSPLTTWCQVIKDECPLQESLCDRMPVSGRLNLNETFDFRGVVRVPIEWLDIVGAGVKAQFPQVLWNAFTNGALKRGHCPVVGGLFIPTHDWHGVS